MFTPLLQMPLGEQTDSSAAGSGEGPKVKIGDAEIPRHPNFRLMMLTKLENPHYLPEISMQAIANTKLYTATICNVL